MSEKKPKRLFRVRFLDTSERKTIEVVVKSVVTSDFLGLVTLEGFVFNTLSSSLILPEEEAAAARYSKTERLHIPYSSISFVEEFDNEPGELKKLPFVKDVSLESGAKPPTAKKPKSDILIPRFGPPRIDH